MESDRLHHLDSLRGIAALSVALWHSLWTFPNIPYHDKLSIVFGFSPVYFFFLLSGFVLTRSFYCKKIKVIDIALFYIRRFFRLYPAALVAIGFGLLVTQIMPIPTPASPYSEGFNFFISEAKHVHSLTEIVKVLVLLNISPNSPLWTIQVEILCSFLLPFLILPTKKYPLLAMPMTVVLVILAWRAEVGQLYDWLKYPFCFFLGSLIYQARQSLGLLSTKATKWLLLFFGILFLFSIRSGLETVVLSLILGGFLAIFVPCNWVFIKRNLESLPFLFLGKISYSLYLIHLPFLWLTTLLLVFVLPDINSYHSLVAGLCVFMFSATIAIGFSVLLEKYIEKPFNKIGHSISKKFNLSL